MSCCVIIPYYNAGESLIRSIESIDYAYIKPDVIVVDDGSAKIRAADVLENYESALDIALVTLKVNMGIEHALNEGIKTCGDNYVYIARLDCGDVCKDKRFEKQIKYLEANPTCYLVGSWVDFTDMAGKFLYTLRQPGTFKCIKKRMFINAAFTHPSVIFRKKVIASVGLYPTNAPAAEDYAYFFSIISKHNAHNIQESLVDCTIDPNGISTQKRRLQIRSRVRVILDNFDHSPSAYYGLVRALLLLCTPRRFTVCMKKLISSS